MKKVVEENGVKLTMSFEIVDQEEFEKNVNKKFQSVIGKNKYSDYSCEIHTLEQAGKRSVSELKAMENENGYSQIDLFLGELAWGKLIDEFKSGKRKDDYEAYEGQQDSLQDERNLTNEMNIWDKKQSDRWNAEDMEDIEDCFNCRHSSLHLGHGGLYCSKTYLNKGIIDSTGVCEKFIKDRRPK